jgi:DNA-binding LacI/PurR family transcriptional regulator
VQPTHDMGRTAVDLLLQLCAGERYLGPACLHHTLRPGGSVGVWVEPPRQSGAS